jgi:predicted signal transduction protein with EAL and GGDEF domain
MRDLGIPLMLDQMGLGPTFLRQLKKLPFRRVKLDRSLILDLETNSESETVVAAIIALAHTCNLAVIADGVETARQMEILRTHGCDQAQGALFSPAVPAETLERLLAQAVPPLSEEYGDPKTWVPNGRVPGFFRKLAQACLPRCVAPRTENECRPVNKLGN